MHHLHDKLPSTTIDFKAFQPETASLFIGHFDTVGNAGEAGSLGFVFTSKRMLENMRRSEEAFGEDLCVMIDGTYRVSSIGWVLANVGVLCCHYNSVAKKYQKSFMAVGLCFMRSESTTAYSEFCSILSSTVYEYMCINFVLTYVIADHSDAIVAGVTQAWPTTKILTCWPHLAQNLKKNYIRLLLNTKERQKVIKAHVYFLHYLPTKSAFKKLAPMILSYWQDTLNERAFAKWFYDTYVKSSHWNSWYMGASGVPGIVGNNNALESAQRVQKTCEADNVCNASNEHIFTKTILDVITYAKIHKDIGMATPGPIPCNLVNTANVIFSRCASPNVCVTKVTEGFVVMGFNGNSSRGNITSAQVENFLAIVCENDWSFSLLGIPKLQASVNDITFDLYQEMPCPLGMHLVTYNNMFS